MNDHLIITTGHSVDEGFSFRIERKDQSEVLRICAEVLDACGIQEKEHFLAGFITTLPTLPLILTGPEDSVIFAPFDLGDESSGYSLRTQHDIILCHEPVHSWRIRRMIKACGSANAGKLLFAGFYLADEMQRAIWEAEAYGTALELAWLRGEPYPTTQSLADHLYGYSCSRTAVGVCRAALESYQLTVDEGGLSPVMQDVQSWWETGALLAA
jgi:hypothetical protein